MKYIYLFFCVLFSVQTWSYTEVIGYTYDDLNRLEQAESGNGLGQTYTYDETHNRLTFERQAVSAGSPVAVNDGYTIDEGETLTVAAAGLLSNDQDPNNGSLSASDFSEPVNGVLTANSDGSFTYVPDSGFYGFDRFVYRASNGSLVSNYAEVVIAVLPDNAVPDIAPRDYETPEDTPIVLHVLADVNDANGDTITIISVSASGDGEVTTDGQTVTYTPAEHYVGTEQLTYVLSDGTHELEATVTVVVVGENDAPVARDDRASVLPGGSIVLPVLSNDTDPDDMDLRVVSVNYSGSGSAVIENNQINYTAPTNGLSDQLTYTVEDSAGLSSTATVYLNLDINLAPVARDDSRTILEDNTVSIRVLDNDSDPNGDDLVVFETSNPSLGRISIVNNVIAYTPNRNITGNDVFSYSIRDSGGLIDTALVRITINRDTRNRRPTPQPDRVTTQPNQTRTFNVLGNDTDPDLDVLTIIGVSQPARGSVSIVGNQIRYVPPAGFEGTTSFYYTVRDPGGLTASTTVTVRVQEFNITPILMLLLDDDCDPGEVLDSETNECVTEGSE